MHPGAQGETRAGPSTGAASRAGRPERHPSAFPPCPAFRESSADRPSPFGSSGRASVSRARAGREPRISAWLPSYLDCAPVCSPDSTSTTKRNKMRTGRRSDMEALSVSRSCQVNMERRCQPGRGALAALRSALTAGSDRTSCIQHMQSTTHHNTAWRSPPPAAGPRRTFFPQNLWIRTRRSLGLCPANAVSSTR